jgi:hypothetical protein
MPLYNYNSNTDSSIKEATNLLKSASEELEKGNFHGVLINTRNSVTNHLTEVIVEGSVKKRRLKTQLKNAFLSRAPTDTYNIYENTIDSLECELLSALSIIHKFIHEDNDNLRLIPMREDLELAYFSIALITTYLGRRLE